MLLPLHMLIPILHLIGALLLQLPVQVVEFCRSHVVVVVVLHVLHLLVLAFNDILRLQELQMVNHSLRFRGSPL